MGLRKRLLGDPSNEELRRALSEGATILDIRLPEEYERGHLPGSLHVPLAELLRELPSIPKDRPVITCNADDAQSATAAEILSAHGYKAYDGGDWDHLARLIAEERGT